MPIYEYQREDGTVFEYRQKISDDPLESCPETGQKVKKLISRTSFRLEGSGWYQTDYGAGSGAAPAAGDDSSDKTAQSESKPATATSESSSSDSGAESSSGCSKGGCGCADDQ